MWSKSQFFEIQIDLPIDCNKTLAPLGSGIYPKCVYSLLSPAEIYVENNIQCWIEPSAIHQMPKIEAINLSDYCSWNDRQLKSNLDKIDFEVMEAKQAIRSPAIYKFDISSKIDELINLLSNTITDDYTVLIHKRAKAKRFIGGLRSSKSNYIGVNLNKNSWQALISLGKQKTYIGSFNKETIAAIAFDFYSIWFHGLEALTNFD